MPSRLLSTADEPDDEPAAIGSAVVFPQLRRRAEDQDHDVEAAVAVEVGHAAAAMGCNRAREAGGRRHVAKPAAAIVEEEAVGLLEVDRFEVADPVVDVRVGREDVLPAVVVDVCERPRTSPMP